MYQHHFSHWLLESKISGHTDATIATNKNLVSPFLDFIGGQEITKERVKDFILHLQEKGAKPSSVLHHFSRIRTFCNYLVSEGVFPSSPLEGMKPPVYRESQIQPFTQADINAFLHAASQSAEPQRNKAIIFLLLDSGVRASELCGIRRGQLDLFNQRARVLGKGNKERTVPFGRNTLRALVDYVKTITPVHQEEEFFFFAWSELKSSRQGMTRNGLLQLVHRLGKRAGVQGVRCSPHTFRHTFAVTYLRNGGDVFSLQQILGHTDLKMTRRYVALANADVEAAHKKFSPGDSLKRR